MRGRSFARRRREPFRHSREASLSNSSIEKTAPSFLDVRDDAIAADLISELYIVAAGFDARDL
jgi:hypothetical protein